MRRSWLWENGSNNDPTVITCHVIRKSCQQIASVKDHFVDLDTIQVFDNYFGVFGEGTRLAMPKTILRAGLIVSEAWFSGY